MAGSYHGRSDESGSDMQESSENQAGEKIGFRSAHNVKFI